jgi:hypothetical protein
MENLALRPFCALSDSSARPHPNIAVQSGFLKLIPANSKGERTTLVSRLFELNRFPVA